MDNAPRAPKLMPLHVLEEITDGFSHRLGYGSYGDVYLGEYKDGKKIAVKVFKDNLVIEDEQFEKEYRNLASLDHKNIVRLVGSCKDTKEEYVPYKGRMVFAVNTKRMICLEFMCNGSLDKFIYDESNAHNWRTRYAIIKGICEGLEYLHEKLKPPMYHLDLKPANVLLDENMLPKVADFGLSRLFLEEKTKKTDSSLGTVGYIPPEYINGGLISIKFDIFSLGVVIIKIMNGRDGYFRREEMSPQQFVERVHLDWINRLQEPYAYSIQARRCIEIALSCVETDRSKRPCIGAIVNNLNKTESMIQILDALRNGSKSPIDKDHQICPCICNETEILKNKLISYPLRVTDNQGRAHEVTITTVGDPAGGTSTFKPVRPRIKIIHCVERDAVNTIDAHSVEPWILVCQLNCHEVSIWNHQNQRRVMAFNVIDRQGGDKYNGTWTAKFIEPGQCFAASDILGYIHVYSYVNEKRLQKFKAHEDVVTSLAVHPSEPLVLSASHDKLIKLWNWKADWRCMGTFEHLDRVFEVRFNPQTGGKTFASCSRDSTIKIWNIDSCTPVATLDCQSEPQWCLGYFTPRGDKQYLVTSSLHRNARIWDLQTNTCIKQIHGLQQGECNIAVVESHLGHSILHTVSLDCTVAFCDSTTHRYENRVKFNLGTIKDFAYIKTIKSLAIGCARGIAIMEMD